MNHGNSLARAVEKYDKAMAAAELARRHRDAAMADAHADGWTYQRLAAHCGMSVDNARRCCVNIEGGRRA